MKKLVLTLLLVAGITSSLAGTTRAQGVNDFVIHDFTADYYLTRDDPQGRSADHTNSPTAKKASASFPIPADQKLTEGRRVQIYTSTGLPWSLDFLPKTSIREAYSNRRPIAPTRLYNKLIERNVNPNLAGNEVIQTMNSVPYSKETYSNLALL